MEIFDHLVMLFYPIIELSFLVDWKPVIVILEVLLISHFIILQRAWTSYSSQTKRKPNTNQQKEDFNRLSASDFQEASKRGDPLADEVVSVLKKHPKESIQSDYLELITKQAQDTQDVVCSFSSDILQATLLKFLQQVNHIPEWVDKKKIAIAQDLYKTHAFAFGAAGFTSLIESFSYQEGVKVLLMTGRLYDKNEIIKRVFETVFWLNSIMFEGAMPGQAGHANCVRVRLLHSFVRHYGFLKKDSLPCYPVNQEDMLHTLMLFSCAALLRIQQLGIIVSDEQKDAYVHLWKYCGYVLGVEEKLLSDSFEEEFHNYQLLNQLQRKPDSNSINLTHHNAEKIAMVPPFFFPRSLVYAVLKWMFEEDDKMAEKLLLPDYTFLHKQVMQIAFYTNRYNSIIMKGCEPLKWIQQYVNQKSYAWAISIKLPQKTTWSFKVVNKES